MYRSVRQWIIISVVVATCSLSATSHSIERSLLGPASSDTYFSEGSMAEPKAQWAISFDNDMFVPGSRDQDYTYGLSIAYSEYTSLNRPFFRLLNEVDKRVGLDSPHVLHGQSIEFGFYGFTPEDISIKNANHTDRPYASLVYLSTSYQRLNDARDGVLHSQLSLGVLGLSFVGDAQKSIHSITASEVPKGWHNQISDGGELTARYSVSYQKNVDLGGFELKSTVLASVGYLTEASWGLSFRSGDIRSTWYKFKPELASYAETSAIHQNHLPEVFFWGGFSVKARAYNAFLQGQFRHSEVDYDYGDLKHAVAEVWIGYSHGFKGGYNINYVLRGHSSEIKFGDGDRDVIWGGFTFTKWLV